MLTHGESLKPPRWPETFRPIMQLWNDKVFKFLSPYPSYDLRSISLSFAKQNQIQLSYRMYKVTNLPPIYCLIF